MEHYFELPVTYRGAEMRLKGRLVTFAYSYKFYIVVNGRELVFEKDDEGKFRAISENADPEIDPQLIADIIQMLEKISSLEPTG